MITVAVMVTVVLPILFGWLSPPVAAVMGVVLMVMLRALTMDQAYRAIDWRAVFVIAGMIPLGQSLNDTGAASLVVSYLIEGLSGYGSWPIIVTLYLVTALGTLVMPNTVLVVLMTPIVFNLSRELAISPYSLMMIVAIAASASFASPISHPANTLVMGPGGYRFIDFLKIGLPMTVLVMIVRCLLLPVFWPFK